MSAATSRSSNEAAAAESASAYLASEPHYLSVAGRILAALQGERRLVAVAGDPPAGAQLLCQALSKLAGPRHRVIGIPCGPELTGDEVFRAGSVVATLPAGGTGATSDTGAPLFVFNEADRLADRQLADICATIQQGTRQNATGVLLGRREFLAGLEEAPLLICGEALAARLRFDEIGDDEGIDFLRHQLAVRHSEDETPRLRPILFRGLAVLGVLVAIAGGGYLTLHYLRMPDVRTPEGRSTPSPGFAAPSIGPPQPVPPAAPSAAPVPPAGSAKPQTGPASTIPAPSSHEQISPPNAPASPAPRGDAAPPQAAPGSLPSPPGSRLSLAEIGALISRGDAFLSAGDIASARSFYERAADAGAAAAALRLGATFDPNFLGRAGVRGNPGDPDQAASWYRRARDLGDAAAAERLKTLDQQAR
jgi:hypothetical protein